MKIQSRLKWYELSITKDFNFLIKLFENDHNYFIIDQNVYNLYLSLFGRVKESRLIIINALEENKNIDTALYICGLLVLSPYKRRTVIVAIGGGIVQDLAGFVSSILYRGIEMNYIPTTLLASADSCIGGKTSLNFKEYKNLIGTFYPPSKIIVSTKFLETLTQVDYFSGLGEIFKFQIILSRGNLKKVLKDQNGILNRNEAILEKYILMSLNYKKNIIEKDEFDKGLRITLNFGHTFGHAIESATNYSIPHGIAVAIGIIIANRISYNRNYINYRFIQESESLLKSIIPSNLRKTMIDFDLILNAIKNDKKQIGASITALLFNNNYQVQLYSDLTEEEIQIAFSKFSKEIISEQ
jgi:3-dehydroquinate synthase